jgi:hypothetical protein
MIPQASFANQARDCCVVAIASFVYTMEAWGSKFMTETPANCNQKCQILKSKIPSQQVTFS